MPKHLFKNNLNLLLPLAAVLLLLAACARTAPVNFYQLAAIAAESPAAAAQPAIGQQTIGIGPVALPFYLDRPQIVTRISANRLQLSDTQRWAEPLNESIPRVLLENLSQALASERMLLHPWPPSREVNLQLFVDVVRFEADETGAAVLEARWSVRGKDGEMVLTERKSRYAVPQRQPGMEEQVNALSETLSRLCSEIAQELRTQR